MARIGFGPEDDTPDKQPEVVPLYVDNPNGEPGWWDDEEEEEWEV